MDNLTHSLTGWALGQTGLKRRTRKGLAALILGANMPDVDVFFGWVPWEPLATHRGFTHGLVGGVLLMPPILAGLLWLLDRWHLRRGQPFTSGLEMHFGWLVALSYVGAISHPLLDWQNSYAVQFLSPFSDKWFHNDALFIIDLWIWLGLGLAIWLSRRREKRGGNWRVPAISALAVLVAYVSVNGVLGERSRQAPSVGAPHAQPEVVVATPPPLAFWRREVIWRQDGAIARGTYDPLRSWTGLVSHTPPISDGMSDPIARQAMTASPQVIAFMRWSLLPMANVVREGCRALVIYEDARFGGRPTVRTMRLSAIVPLKRPNCPPGLEDRGT